MAAMVNHINNLEERHIITIEDPIEYVHQDNKSVIIQRSVGEDTESFATALKHTLRHDPDIIVVGEMRDLTTIGIAISAAETGHLVFGTLHTINAGETIDRVVEVFPTGQQAQIRLQLSQVLVAVLSQTLVRRNEGGRIPACEIMICNTAIRHLIREGQIHQLYSNIQLGHKEGMQTLNQSLATLVSNNIVSREEAMRHCSDVEQLETALKHAKLGMLSPQAAYIQ
jgi:twitching motility protein PilT